MTAAYLAAFAVGGVAVLAALLLTDVELGHDGLPFLSLTSLSAGVLGAGTGGLVATWLGAGTVASAVVAVVVGLVVVGALQGLLLPFLRRQQSNSQRGRASYIGLLGTVTLAVPTDGWGEVAFVDTDGNRVRARAITAEPDTLPKSTPVYIADVDADYVHVVTIPGADPELPTSERN
ncbi:uncharacterized membrane protein YuzA (DUF378 family) [Mycolicibacterium iranicum]|uniref:Uncharacterized membrane protein YuzA (DUF378 family) n=1 Tax=Mycolicibacterium iranicum TaxID=912594 RepID=A0A839Q2L3_MYCIR|nr:hypothetical protein [Mycolicibacterium iranicum]MBB2989917.1 uncharacterized membrane protein YuzA (DUF378 family) [Mycolicibacterium iranicum]